jgi:hypothetical protein
VSSFSLERAVEQGLEEVVQEAAGGGVLRVHRPNLVDAGGAALVIQPWADETQRSPAIEPRLPLGDTGREKKDRKILKIVRLRIEPRNHSVVQFIGLLLGRGLGFSEIENIAHLVILNRQGRFHVFLE